MGVLETDFLAKFDLDAEKRLLCSRIQDTLKNSSQNALALLSSKTLASKHDKKLGELLGRLKTRQAEPPSSSKPNTTTNNNNNNKTSSANAKELFNRPALTPATRSGQKPSSNQGPAKSPLARSNRRLAGGASKSVYNLSVQPKPREKEKDVQTQFELSVLRSEKFSIHTDARNSRASGVGSYYQGRGSGNEKPFDPTQRDFERQRKNY